MIKPEKLNRIYFSIGKKYSPSIENPWWKEKRFVQVSKTIAKIRMVDEWLVDLMRGYNHASLESKDDYAAVVFLDGALLSRLILDGLKALPDEILVGLDYNGEKEIHESFLQEFSGIEYSDNLFAGQKYIIDEGLIVNRGDSYSVHHLPEDWTDDMFSATRGSRRSRFTTFAHSSKCSCDPQPC